MERDDIIEYSLGAQHSEEEGKKIRKNVWKVTAILSVITFVEVLVGILYSKTVVGDGNLWATIKTGYIILTVIKARYIILEFMHLGHERSSFKSTILYPYLFLILYLIFIAINESLAVYDFNFPIN